MFFVQIEPLDSGRPNFLPDMAVDPMDFWRLHAKKLPLLARVARKYLAIPASSAAVERMFSYTGNRVGKNFTRMSDEMLLNLMLVRAFSKFIDQWGPVYL